MFSVVERFLLAVVFFCEYRTSYIGSYRKAKQPTSVGVQCYAAVADVGVLTSITVTMPRLPQTHLTPARRPGPRSAQPRPSSPVHGPVRAVSLSGGANW